MCQRRQKRISEFGSKIDGKQWAKAIQIDFDEHRTWKKFVMR